VYGSHCLPLICESQQRWTIPDALTANYLAAMWENRGKTAQAAVMRDIRDRRIAEFDSIKPPKDTIICYAQPPSSASTCTRGSDNRRIGCP
jgi:hypothetical protein